MGPDLQTAAAELTQALQAARPDPLLAWALEPHGLVDTSSGCPLVTAVEQEGGTMELWEGDCVQPDGTRIEGQLRWFDGHSTAWASAEGFAVIGPEGLIYSLDGAVEIQGEDALWLAEANATACAGQTCSTGLIAVDLSYTIFPAEGYPQDYDLTVSGVVAGAEESGTIMIEGAWSIDDAACESEPVQGLVAVKRGAHQTLHLDGASACDTCADWVVQGRVVPAFCGTLR